MADFDPDAYLKQQPAFDPDAYLKGAPAKRPDWYSKENLEAYQKAQQAVGMGTLSGIGQMFTGIGELLPQEYGGRASAEATQALKEIGEPGGQAIGKAGAAIAPFTAGAKLAQFGLGGLKALGRTITGVEAVPAIVAAPARIVGSALEGAAGGAAAGAAAPTGMVSEEERFKAKQEEAKREALFGAAIGGGVGTLGEVVRGIGALRDTVPTELLQWASKGASKDQFEKAISLMEAAKARGVDLTSSEAIQFVTGNATNMGKLQRILEGSKGGGEVFQPFMANRPAQTQAATEAMLQDISARVERPYDIPLRTQKIGEEIRSDVDKLRSQAVEPYYQAAKQVSVNPNAVAAIVNDIRATAASDKSGILSGPLKQMEDLLIARKATPETASVRQPVKDAQGNIIRYEVVPGQKAVPEEYVTDFETLDRVRKYLRDTKIENPAYLAEATSKEQSSVLGEKLNALRDRLERNVDAFAQGRREFERQSRKVEKFAASPSGQLAAAETPAAQAGVLFPAAPLPGSERGISNVFQSIANRDPELAKQLIRQQLEATANKSVNAVTAMGAPNEFGGAGLATFLRRNPQAEKNLLAAVEASGGNPQNVTGLLDVLQATGQRQRQGSLTAFNKEFLDTMSPNIKEAVTSPLKAAGERFTQAAMESRSRELSKLLTSGPDGLRRVQQIAMGGTPDAIIARQLLTGMAASGTQGLLSQ
jgi:hypothetical protein